MLIELSAVLHVTGQIGLSSCVQRPGRNKGRILPRWMDVEVRSCCCTVHLIQLRDNSVSCQEINRNGFARERGASQAPPRPVDCVGILTGREVVPSGISMSCELGNRGGCLQGTAIFPLGQFRQRAVPESFQSGE